MRKITTQEILDEIMNIKVSYKGELIKIDQIKEPYESKRALSLEVVKQILIETSDEQFLDLIQKAHVFNGEAYPNSSYYGDDATRVHIDDELNDLQDWVNKFPISNYHGRIKEAIHSNYINNTYIYTDDFLLWIKNSPNRLIKVFTSGEERVALEVSCWYTEKILEGDTNRAEFGYNAYLPKPIKTLINEGDEMLLHFIRRVIDFKESSNTVRELCENVEEEYSRYYNKKISYALLGFLVRPKSQSALTSDNCNKFAKRLMDE